eukprot:5271903-Pyramimonas_sp.AAC.1
MLPPESSIVGGVVSKTLKLRSLIFGKGDPQQLPGSNYTTTQQSAMARHDTRSLELFPPTLKNE